ncbi:MAG: aspartate/glutamate racemase family protein [Clostridia bacterium]|nr:aspartate/glutamate racemase family protein [Clostridia bacterium]
MENKSCIENPLIAVFDSGIGGLNLLKECTRRMPQADFAYFADNYNMPYGNLSEGEITKRAFNVFGGIARLKPVAAAVACNTVTACCIDKLRAKCPFPIAGIQPAVKQAAETGGRFLVLATNATKNSRSFNNLVFRYGGNALVAGCSGLAAAIEDNIFDLDKIDLSAYLPKGKFSAVVLGCTHYIFIGERLKKIYGCPIFDGIAGTADHLKEISGIFDHETAVRQKITFFGGDIVKNRAVFDSISQ